MIGNEPVLLIPSSQKTQSQLSGRIERAPNLPGMQDEPGNTGISILTEDPCPIESLGATFSPSLVIAFLQSVLLAEVPSSRKPDG